MVWHNDVRKAEQGREKIIVAEIQRRERAAAQADQDRYYQPYGKSRGQDVEIKIER
jgi:hypothetical protein